MRASWIMRCKTPDGKVLAGTVSTLRLCHGRGEMEFEVNLVLKRFFWKLCDDGIVREESEDWGEEVLWI